MSANKEEYDRNAGLANLTDEERAAIAGDDLSEDEKAALQDIAGDEDIDDDLDDDADDGGDDDNQDDDAADAESAADVPAATEGKPAKAPDVAAPAAADTAADAEEGEDVAAPAVYQAALPDDFDERVKAIDDAETEAARKFEAGEIEAPAYVIETRRIATERGELDRHRVKAEVAAEMTQQAAMNQWQRQVSQFMREAKKADGVDYLKDEALNAELDTMVKALASNPVHANKSGAWFLGQAHKAVKAMHGITSKPAADPKPAATNDGKPASRKPPIDKAPKTLAQVPGGEGPGDVADEFVNLDNLDGDDYENALAKLTPSQRQRYLAAV